MEWRHFIFSKVAPSFCSTSRNNPSVYDLDLSASVLQVFTLRFHVNGRMQGWRLIFNNHRVVVVVRLNPLTEAGGAVVGWLQQEDVNEQRQFYIVLSVKYNLDAFVQVRTSQRACVGHYGSPLAHGPREPTARGPLMPPCSRTPCAWASSFDNPFDFMKNPDIGDVMNKFEVLGIVGEGKRFPPVQTGSRVSWGNTVALCYSQHTTEEAPGQFFIGVNTILVISNVNAVSFFNQFLGFSPNTFPFFFPLLV